MTLAARLLELCECKQGSDVLVPASVLLEAADGLKEREQLQKDLDQARDEMSMKPSVARKLNARITSLEAELEQLRSKQRVQELEKKVAFLEVELKQSYATKNFTLKQGLLDLEKLYRKHIDSDPNMQALWADVTVMLDEKKDVAGSASASLQSRPNSMRGPRRPPSRSDSTNTATAPAAPAAGAPAAAAAAADPAAGTADTAATGAGDTAAAGVVEPPPLPAISTTAPTASAPAASAVAAKEAAVTSHAVTPSAVQNRVDAFEQRMSDPSDGTSTPPHHSSHRVTNSSSFRAGTHAADAHRGGGQGVVVEEGTRPVAETKLQHAGPALHAPESWPHHAQGMDTHAASVQQQGDISPLLQQFERFVRDLEAQGALPAALAGTAAAAPDGADTTATPQLVQLLRSFLSSNAQVPALLTAMAGASSHTDAAASSSRLGTSTGTAADGHGQEQAANSPEQSHAGTQAALAAEVSDMGTQAGQQAPTTADAAAQGGTAADTAEAASQAFLRPEAADASTQGDAAAASADAGSQAALSPETADTGTGSHAAVISTNVASQAALLPETTDAGVGSDTPAASTDTGTQAGLRPEVSDVGVQGEAAAASADAGSQAVYAVADAGVGSSAGEGPVASTDAGVSSSAGEGPVVSANAGVGSSAGEGPVISADAGSQAALQPERSDVGVQGGPPAATAEVGSQAAVAPETADAGVQGPAVAASADAGSQAALVPETADAGVQGEAGPSSSEAQSQAALGPDTAEVGTQGHPATATGDASTQSDAGPATADAGMQAVLRPETSDAGTQQGDAGPSANGSAPNSNRAVSAAAPAGNTQQQQREDQQQEQQQQQQRDELSSTGSGVLYEGSGSELARNKVAIGQSLDILQRLSRRSTAEATAEAAAVVGEADADSQAASDNGTRSASSSGGGAVVVSPAAASAAVAAAAAGVGGVEAAADVRVMPAAIVAKQMAVLQRLKDGYWEHAGNEEDVVPEQLTDLVKVAKELNTLKASNIQLAAQLQVHESLVAHLNSTMKAAVERADDSEHSLRDIGERLSTVLRQHDRLQTEHAEVTMALINAKVELAESKGELLQLVRTLRRALQQEDSMAVKMRELDAILGAVATKNGSPLAAQAPEGGSFFTRLPQQGSPLKPGVESDGASDA